MRAHVQSLHSVMVVHAHCAYTPAIRAYSDDPGPLLESIVLSRAWMKRAAGMVGRQ
jgi:hypothetical protein